MKRFHIFLLIFISTGIAQSQFKLSPEIMKLNNVFQVINSLYVDSVPQKKIV